MQAYIAKKSGTRKSATFPKGGVSNAGELKTFFFRDISIFCEVSQ